MKHTQHEMTIKLDIKIYSARSYDKIDHYGNTPDIQHNLLQLDSHTISLCKAVYDEINKMLSYRRETALQGAL